ncbi:MAG TPA: 50S ribosomal protein L25 [Myxococcaceae bacterium]|nr:50S ribosomal protein L25 [Myxococcaceae bacterium]
MATDSHVLTGKPRQGAGKGPARRLRAAGQVPAIVYGRGLEAPAHIAVDPLEVKHAIASPMKFNTLITLKVEGQPDRLVLLKDYQQDPVTREMVHADFLAVRENEEVKVNVPLVLVGKPEGVVAGGILSQNRREIEVYVLPSAIPAKLEADVTALKIAQSLHIRDVALPAGVRVKSHVNYTVAVVNVPEKEEIPAPVAAPAAGAAAPGAAPAAGTAAPAEGKPGAPAPAGDAKAPAPAAGAKKDDKKK